MANSGRQAPSAASMMLNPEVVAPSTASNDVAAGLSHPRHGDHLRIAKALTKPVNTTATNSTLPPGSFQPGQDGTFPRIAGAGRVPRAQCRGPMRLQGLDRPDDPAAGGHRQRVIGESAGHRGASHNRCPARGSPGADPDDGHGGRGEDLQQAGDNQYRTSSRPADNAPADEQTQRRPTGV